MTMIAGVEGQVLLQKRTSLSDVLVWFGLISTALPTILGVAWKVDVGIGSVYVSDPLMLLSFLIAIRNIRRTPLVALFFVSTVGFCVIGILQGATLGAMLRDGRPAIYAIIGLVVGAYILSRPQSFRLGSRMIVTLIGVTAVLAVVGQLSGIPIVGDQSGSNEIYYAGERRVLESQRVQSEPVALALMVLCLLLAFYVFRINIIKVVGTRTYYLGVVSSVILTLFAYSRNSLVAIAVVVVLSLLIPSSLSRMNRLGRLVTLVALSIVFVFVPVWIAYQYGYFGNVVETFSSRVLAGIAPDVLATDPSVGWRYIETEFALSFILENPILGSGLGAFYRDYFTGEPFSGDSGRLYIHNFFVLVLVKFGVIGGALLLFAFVVSILRMIRVGCEARTGLNRIWSAYACAFASILVVNLVSPSLYSRSFAAFGGCLLVAGLLSRSYRVDKI